MNAYITFLLEFLTVSYLFTQNLVPNHSFEVYDICPAYLTTKPRFNLIPDWTLPTMGTSDYFHECSNSSSVPRNSMGFKYAYSGIAYTGLITMIHNKQNNNIREYLQAKLNQKLIKGEQYFVQLFYAVANSSKYTSDRLGIYLSPGMIDSSNYLGNLALIPQIETKPGKFKLTSNGWNSLSGYYKAKGNETYIIIGNFRDNATTKKEINPLGDEIITYFYIDFVTVRQVFKKLENELSNTENEFQISIKEEAKVLFNPDKDYFTNSWYIFENMTFDFNKYEINQSAFDELDEIVKTMIINQSVNILISGHTDLLGSELYNQKLSEQRAKTVSDYLIKNGIPKTRVKYLGYGKQKPLYNNSKAINFEESRRVEFLFY